MSPLEIANILAYIAAGIGIVMFIPQAIRIWKTKNTKSISLVSFSLFGFASLLWTVYGLIMKAPPIVLVNVVIMILSLYIVLMKLKYG